MKSLFTWLFLAICLNLSAQTGKPRIIILGTGGTIAGAGTSASRAGYTAGKIPVEDLIGGIPAIKEYADVSGEQISSVGSQDMTIAIWQKLDKRINEIAANKEADGIVITHGTDTQEETAFFLNLTVRSSDIPVVLTGSMRPATGMSADGPKNLFDAILVAADPKSKGRGVIALFNENILDGRDMIKVNTTKVEAFSALNTGPIGQVYDAKVVYYMHNDRSDLKTPFDISKVTTLPRVEIVYLYADAPADVVDFWISKKVDGLVLAGVGNGNMNAATMDAVKRAVAAGIKVVRSTRIPAGRVVLEDEVDDAALGTIASDDHNPQKARILLMLGLTQTKDTKKLQEYFLTY